MTTDLPWNRFGEPPAEEPELPYVPPSDQEWRDNIRPGPVEKPVEQPEPVPPEEGFDLGKLAQEAFHAALNEALPGVKSNALDMLKTSVQAAVQGKEVDWEHPTVIAVTDRGKELVVADAKSRSWRTLLQGLAIDLFFAALVLLGTLTQADVLDKASWTIFFALLVKTIIQTTVSFFMRLKITPTIKEDGERYDLLPVPSPIPKGQDRAA